MGEHFGEHLLKAADVLGQLDAQLLSSLHVEAEPMLRLER